MCAQLHRGGDAGEAAVDALRTESAPTIGAKRKRARPKISDADFQVLKCIINDDKRARRFRNSMLRLIGFYAELLPHVALTGEKAARSQVQQLSAAIQRLNQAMTALGNLGTLRLARALGVSLQLHDRDHPFRKAFEACARLDAACGKVLAPLPRGRRRTSDVYLLMLEALANAYGAATGAEPTVTTRTDGNGYGGKFYTVATIVCRAMADAAGETYRGDMALGRLLKAHHLRLVAPKRKIKPRIAAVFNRIGLDSSPSSKRKDKK
jgi:hypothetical protein